MGGSGLSARWGPPGGDWWPQVSALGLPVVGPLALPASAAMAVVAIRGRRFGAGLCAFGLAALFAGWALRTSSPASAPEGAPTFSVTTLNVGASSLREGEVTAFVERESPDVLLLQEAGAAGRPYAPVVGRVATLDGYEVYVDPVVAETGNPGRQVTVSRLPVVSYESGPLGTDELTAGVYSRAVVEWSGGLVVVYNVHLRAYNPEVGWSWRRALSPAVWAETPGRLRDFLDEQAIEAEALARMVAAESLPTVVAGDFNSGADQWSRAVLARSLRETTGRWLPNATRPDDQPLVNVDGILVSPAWALARAHVGPGGLSDHRPVSASLSLR